MDKEDLNIIRSGLINNNFTDYEKRVIINSINKLKNKELNKITKEEVIRGLKEIAKDLEEADSTYLTQSRILKELKILEKLQSNDLTEEELVNTSFDVECLYYDNDIPPRGTNTVVEYVKNMSRKGNSNGKSN